MINETARAANIDMRVGIGGGDHLGQFEFLLIGAAVVVIHHAVGETRFSDAIAESRTLRRTRAIVHGEVRTGGGEALGHAQDGRDADAAGQQQGAFGLRQRKVIARFADGQHVADFDVAVHGNRTAARVGVAQHTDLIAMAFMRWIAQRILANQAVAVMHVDVGCGRGYSNDSNDGNDRSDRPGRFRNSMESLDHAASAVTEDGCSFSFAIHLSSRRRDCTPPASMFSISNLRSGCLRMFCCCISSMSRSSPKILPWPSRMAAVSSASCGLKLRAMPQKYQCEVSVSGVMKSTTMLDALYFGSAS